MPSARAAVTSLWKVPDDVTQQMTGDFYRRLWQEGKPKAQALWEAKRAIRARREADGSPRYAIGYSAGWVLSGDLS